MEQNFHKHSLLLVLASVLRRDLQVVILDGSYSIQELYEAMAIYSANAATIAIAETIAGTEENFVKLMNEKAEEMGIEVHFNTGQATTDDLKTIAQLLADGKISSEIEKVYPLCEVKDAHEKSETGHARIRTGLLSLIGQGMKHNVLRT